MFKDGVKNSIDDNEDRISGLPDDLLHLIMFFLTTLQVVRTCILSKRWKNVWTTLPYLDYKLSEFDRNNQSERSACEKFKDFVSMSLLYRADINVHKFHLCFPSIAHSNLDVHCITNWICYVLEHNPRELYTDTRWMSLPREIFTCSSLEDIHLHVVIIPKNINLPNLKRLYLWCVLIYQDIMERLLYGCPLVEELHLRACLTDVSNIRCKSLKYLQIENFCTCRLHRCKQETTTIDTPNLQSFKYKGHSNYFGNIMLVSMSSLYDGSSDLILCGSFTCDKGTSEQITNQLSNVQNCKLRCVLLKDFFQRELPFFPRLSKLKSLLVHVSVR